MSLSEREERFKRVASRRTNAILNSIKSLAKCSNRSNYEYSEKQVKKIFNSIQNELRLCKNSFNRKKVEKDTFKL